MAPGNSDEMRRHIEQRFVEKDEEALTLIVQYYAPVLTHLLKKRLGIRFEDAEEIVSDGITKLATKGRFDPQRGSLWVYLKRICYRLALDKLEKLRSRQSIELPFDETRMIIETMEDDVPPIAGTIGRGDLRYVVWEWLREQIVWKQIVATTEKFEEAEIQLIAARHPMTPGAFRTARHRILKDAYCEICQRFGIEGHSRFHSGQ